MTYTTQSDLFASVTEGALNRVLTHIRRRRPSLFNYGTQWVADDWRERLCELPDVAPEVLHHSNPVVTVEDPIPVLGTNGAYALNFGAQLTKLSIDLSPQSAPLPPQLGALPAQHLALSMTVCAGLAEVDLKDLANYPPIPQKPVRVDGDIYVTGDASDYEQGRDERAAREAERERLDREIDRYQKAAGERGTVVLPTRKLRCCCIELHAVAHVEKSGPPGNEVLSVVLDAIEIVDITPDCLESTLEQYLWLMLTYAVLPRLRIAVPVITLNLMKGLPQVTVTASTTVPFNPSIDDDALSVYADVKVGP